jgi:hypothetical protein
MSFVSRLLSRKVKVKISSSSSSSSVALQPQWALASVNAVS